MIPERKKRAADILRYYATSLFDANSIRGEWAEGTEEEQKEANEMLDLADGLYLDAVWEE